MARKRKPTQESVWDMQMLHAIADYLHAPFELVWEAWAKEMQYRIRQAQARAETAQNVLAAYQAALDDLKKQQDNLQKEG